MEKQEEIELLKTELLSFDWERLIAAANQLNKIGGKEGFEYFISLLDLDNNYNLSRNVAALTLREIGNNDAVEPLFKAILKQENINYNGSLVYALEKLDCSFKFKELFQILFYHGLEAKLGAHTILSEQQFSFDSKDLNSIMLMWDDIKLHPEKANHYDISNELIEDCVHQYLIYLETE